MLLKIGGDVDGRRSLTQNSDLGSHADYATTDKYYAHLTPEGDSEAVRKIKL